MQDLVAVRPNVDHKYEGCALEKNFKCNEKDGVAS